MAVIPPDNERIPANRVPVVENQTRFATKEWYRYFLALFRLVLQGGNTTSIQDILIAPGSSGAGVHVPAYAYGSFSSASDQYVGIANEAYPIEFGLNGAIIEDGVRQSLRGFDVLANSVAGTMAVSTVVDGTLFPGMVISGTGVTAGNRIVRQISGTTGGLGTYELDTADTFGTISISGLSTAPVKVYRTGTYSFSLRLQIVSTAIVDHQIDVWARGNGVDIVGSNTKVTARPNDGSNDGYTPVTLTFGIQCAMGDIIEFMWSTSDVTAAIVALAAQVTPDRPYSPSAALVASMISVPTLQSAAA